MTIVTPTLNCGAYISATLCSLRSVGMPIRHIVVDGGSTDGTLEHLRGAGVAVSRQRSAARSMYAAINEGIEKADTEWVTFLNGDDLTMPRAYAHLIKEGTASGADVVYGDGCRFRMGANGVAIDVRAGMASAAALLHSGGLPFFQPSAVFRRSLWVKMGGFDERFRVVGDWEFFLRASLSRAQFRYAGRGIASAFRLTGTSLGDRETALGREERAQVLARAGVRRMLVSLTWQRAVRPLRTAVCATPAERAECRRFILACHEAGRVANTRD